MKFLEYTPLNRINGFLNDLNLGESTIKGSLEAYSCKHTGTDKRDSVLRTRSLTILGNPRIQTPAHLSRVELEFELSHPELSFYRALTYRKTLIYLVLTLNHMYPDYDFSAVKAHQFFTKESWDTFKQIFDTFMLEASKYVGQAISSIHSIMMSSLLETIYKALDEVVKLSECEIYSYNPDSNADPFLEKGAIRPFSFFFYNRKPKRVVSFSFCCLSNLVADGFVADNLCYEEDGEIFNNMDICDFALSDSRLPQQLVDPPKGGSSNIRNCLAAINERPVDFSDDNKWIEMDGNTMANFHLALADELTSLSCKIREQKRAELLLQSIPDSYDHLIINLKDSNATSLVFDDVAAVVLQEENWRKNKEDRQANLQQAEALTTMRGRSKERGQSSSHKHGRSKSRSKKNLKCYNCGKKCHLKNDCWSLNKNFNPQGPNKDHIEELKAQLAREFEMKDLGSANKILGMQIFRDKSNRKIWLSQNNYLKKILSRFNMQDCKPISIPLPINFKLSTSMSHSSEEERMKMSRVPYASVMGSLIFTMICTRPDIAQAVGVVSRYMANPDKEHWNTIKRILRYIKGTSNVALCYG
ncbi:NAC domain-containing protein 2-like [Hibiscus syriacus]|uniref:NAC domain-containing protein 2-like n=1 Tax=Hibiscus syriacus TaxID=106335 RepID=A0A6A3BZ46_HIBSY|nr:NAC domain-containing protein 2-like [Hibiscus syriacus]